MIKNKFMSLNELGDELSISYATAKNWLKLGKLKPQLLQDKKVLFSKEYVYSLKQDISMGNNPA